MHRIQLRAIGKSTEPWQTEAIKEYLHRLTPFAKMDVLKLPEGHDRSAKPDPTKTRANEAEALLNHLPEGAWVVALDETGKNLASAEFAAKLEDWSSAGRTVVFMIGGSWGLDASVRSRANAVLSFGKQTLPHLLARIVLLEQLYRAETILTGKTYHK